MDLPPSGWYPDPYGVPGLLRWWDATAWTEHTYAETTPTASAPAATASPTAQATAYQPAVTAVQPATVQPTRVQPAIAQGTSVQPTTVQPAVTQGTSVQPTTVQPTAVQLGGLRPPSGQPTTPQPAIPAGMAGAGGGDGTRVLFLNDTAWTAPGAPSRAPEGERSGYYRSRHRRRILLASGLAGGVAVALGVIALVVNSLGQSGQAPTAEQTAPAHVAASSAPSAAPSAAASPSPTASASPTAPPGSLSTVTDATSGLTYGQLSAPWGPGCPAAGNGQAFSWTAGESAVAGQVNNGQTPWYGVACSGSLPQQYGYNGTADLENVTVNLANTFNGTYYAALPHTTQTTESVPVSISGHPGWEVEFLVTYTNPQGLAWTNELGAVVVADPQTGAAPAVFYTSVPGNLNEANVTTLVSSLQLAAVAPPPGSTPTATAPGTTPPSLPPAAPPPGGGNPGGNNGQGGGQNN